MRWQPWLGWVVAVLAASAALARPLTLEDVAREGELRLLEERPDAGAYRYQAEVTLDEQSLRTGLVLIHTCHLALDPNPRIVVAFNPQRVERLAVTRAEGVGRAWVDGHRVELADVQRGASVCIDVQSRALEPLSEGRWRLHAGPLMRRYLDGYLPMEAQLTLRWPPGLLTVARTEPAPQPGVVLTTDASGAQLSVTFAGRLRATWELVRP
jgi:hypothetical protein